MLFKEWVKTISAADLSKAIQDIKKASEFLLGALQMLVLNESSYEVDRVAQDKIIRNPKFYDWMKTKYNATPISQGVFGLSKSCGKDGCAYFYTNDIVVKITTDNREYNIANAVKGNLDTVPIIDTAEFDIDGWFYAAIVMKKVDTDFYRLHAAGITQAANLMSGICWNLQSKVSKDPNISPDYIKKRLSMAYMLREVGDVPDNVKTAMKDLVKVLRLVYTRSGYLFGADWENGRNVGLSDKGKAQPYDFGRSDAHKSYAYSLDIPRSPNNFGEI